MQVSGRLYPDPRQVSGRLHPDPRQVSGRLHPNPRQVSGRLHPDPHLLPSVSPVCWQLFPTTLPPEICSLLFPDFLQISTPSSPFCNAFSNRPSQTTS